MISGGENAMVSPVVRISTPRAQHSRKMSKARALPGAAGESILELHAADHRCCTSMTWRAPLQRMQRILEVGRHLRGARQLSSA